MTAVASIIVVVVLALARTQDVAPVRPSEGTEARVATLADAQRAFYSGRYEEAADMSLRLCAAGADDLEACELRTSSLHFQIRRAMGDAPDREQAWKMCATCPGLMSSFLVDTERARALARARLQRDANEEAALFLLGKIDLNYVWLQLGTRGRKTGWDEYWEARNSLDQVLERNPDHLRARVARAWIDYIVGTKMPRGTRWLLGGGSKKRGLQVVREAASSEGEFFERAEAAFALWDMQVRERELAEAVATARQLARDFPDNRELTRFLTAHQGLKP
jgi:tetratricopeptide (TPR) repeat protein